MGARRDGKPECGDPVPPQGPAGRKVANAGVAVRRRSAFGNSPTAEAICNQARSGRPRVGHATPMVVDLTELLIAVALSEWPVGTQA
jgi:hypothetical protein